MTERLRDQSGYSLVEVMVAIMILAIAIIPMVGMFDTGLRAAVLGGNYDTARALASAELDGIRALPYHTPPNPPADSVREIYPPANGPSPPSGGTVPCQMTVPSGFTCRVETAFVSIGDPGSTEITPDPSARTMMSVEVRVEWDDGRSYSTAGIVAK